MTREGHFCLWWYNLFMNIKKALLIVLLAVASLYFLLGAKKSDVAPLVPAETDSIQVIVKSTDYIDIKAKYPTKTPLSGENGVKASLSLKNFVEGKVSEFEKMIEDEMLTQEEKARLLEMNRKYGMGIDYKSYTSHKYISYVFNIYEDTGGAHPNSYNATISFDKNGNEVKLPDLFKSDSRYLDRLSDISYKSIVKDATLRFESALDDDQKDWIRMGTAPTPEALQFFYLDGDNLVLIFPPYQVAAYVAGTFEVHIPLSTLSDILK